MAQTAELGIAARGPHASFRGPPPPPALCPLVRLDADAEAAVQRPSRVPTAAEARAYLESLRELWASTSDAGFRAIAEAVIERIDVLGAGDYTFTLTAAAKARGWDAAFGPGVLRIPTDGGRGKTSHSDDAPKQGVLSTKEGQSGRGERNRGSGTRQIRGCRVTMGGHQGPVDLVLTA